MPRHERLAVTLPFNFRSLRFRLLLASTLVEIVMLALLLANSVRLINEAMITSADNAVEQMVPTLNVIAATNLVTGDLATLQDNLNAIVGKREQGLAYVVIEDLDGERVLAGNMKADALPRPHPDLSAALSVPILHVARPITLGGQLVGTMQFGLSTAVIARAKADLLRQGAIIAAIEIVLTFALLSIVGYWLTSHLETFVEGSQAVAKGRFDLVLPVKGEDEVAQLATNFNAMTAAVRERIDALARSEAEFRTLFEQAAVGIAHFTLDHKVIRSNAKLAEILHLEKEELRELSWEALSSPEDWPAAREACAALLTAQKASVEFEARWRKEARTGVGMGQGAKLSSFAWVRVTASLHRDAGGSPIYYIAVVQDIGVEKAVRAEVQHYRQHLEDLVEARTHDLEAANRELEAFSYSVSHDLRAPVRTIGSFSAILKKDIGKKLDDESLDFLERINRSATRMAQMIDALLELSRVGRAELRREPCDLSALAQEMCDELRQVRRGQVVECAIEPGLKTVADPRLMGLVLQNLLGNAWKFSSKQPNARVEFAHLPKAVKPTFLVRDNGVGFDGTHSGRLFAPFQRLHAEGAFEGTGIGLATVQRIIQRHGGRVWAEGVPGKGATFYFEIPAEKAP
jgi:PAS domain S-box-containing protein